MRDPLRGRIEQHTMRQAGAAADDGDLRQRAAQVFEFVNVREAREVDHDAAVGMTQEAQQFVRLRRWIVAAHDGDARQGFERGVIASGIGDADAVAVRDELPAEQAADPGLAGARVAADEDVAAGDGEREFVASGGDARGSGDLNSSATPSCSRSSSVPMSSPSPIDFEEGRRHRAARPFEESEQQIGARDDADDALLGGPGRLHRDGLESQRARARPHRAALAGAFIQPWTEPGPGDQVASGRKDCHVVPISATSTLAAVVLSPGIVVRRPTAARKGGSMNVVLARVPTSPVNGMANYSTSRPRDSDSTQPLLPGMVFAIEPGIYIPEERIGVRIEDMFYVAGDGTLVNMSRRLPRRIEEIERIMAEAKRQRAAGTRRPGAASRTHRGPGVTDAAAAGGTSC